MTEDIAEVQYIVRVGAGPQGAVPAFEEFAGQDFWGPMTREEARLFEAAVRTAFERLGEQDPQGFVYGEIVIETHPCSPAVDRLTVGDAAKRAAANWWLDAEGREAI